MKEEVRHPLEAGFYPKVPRDQNEDIDPNDGQCFAPYLPKGKERMRVNRPLGREVEREEVGMQDENEEHRQDAE